MSLGAANTALYAITGVPVAPFEAQGSEVYSLWPLRIPSHLPGTL